MEKIIEGMEFQEYAILPEVENKIYYGNEKCEKCDTRHSIVAIDENTVVLEFYKNYYIPKYTGCSWNEDERYCVLVKWEDFIKFPKNIQRKHLKKGIVRFQKSYNKTIISVK